jgi:hypothetical protein
MASDPCVRRIVLLVLDGLRPDAIDAFALGHLDNLRRSAAHTLTAQTVTPSVTAAAMGSLLTGAPPTAHGLDSARFRVPVPRSPLHPLPKVLAAHRLPTSAHMARLPIAFRPVGQAIAFALGLAQAAFHGTTCDEILAGASRSLLRQRDGLIIVHLPDGDTAGHRDGWMSAHYAAAARRMDSALGALCETTNPISDPETLLIVLADHGGGGATSHDHDSLHPHDVSIPIILAGRDVTPGPLSGPVSLLDVPATVLWAFGIPQPASYTGRPLVEAFAPALAAA